MADNLIKRKLHKSKKLNQVSFDLMVQILQALFYCFCHLFLRYDITNHKYTPILPSHQVPDQTVGNL